MAIAEVGLRPLHVGHGAQQVALSVATVVLACSTAASLVPAAVAALSAPPVASPVAVSLLGTVSTAGLPQHAAVSRMSVRNDSSVPIRWSVSSKVLGPASPGVLIAVWTPVDDRCGNPPPGSTGSRDWSPDVLPAGAAVPLCVRVSILEAASGTARPSVTVHAREA